jgi:hypothetical protein
MPKLLARQVQLCVGSEQYRRRGDLHYVPGWQVLKHDRHVAVCRCDAWLFCCCRRQSAYTVCTELLFRCYRLRCMHCMPVRNSHYILRCRFEEEVCESFKQLHSRLHCHSDRCDLRVSVPAPRPLPPSSLHSLEAHLGRAKRQCGQFDHIYIVFASDS